MKDTPVWGFTKGERHAILLVCAATLIGVGYRFYQRSATSEMTPITAQDSAAIAAIKKASKSQAAVLFNQDNRDTSTVSSGSPSSVDAANLLDLNCATQAQLEALPGIGPVLARRILETRDQLGGFQHLEELLEVPGIGSGRLEQLRRRVICRTSGLLSNPNPK